MFKTTGTLDIYWVMGKNYKLKIAWASDTHFNLTTHKRIKKLCAEVVDSDADCLIITGDIAESDSICYHLEYLQSKIKIPLYFVYGNHDVYKTSIEDLEIKLGNLNIPNITWLTQKDFISLTEDVALVGHENWWDCHYGADSPFQLLNKIVMYPDYALIEDFAGLSVNDRTEKLKQLAKKSTLEIMKKIDLAFDKHEEVILATHVPPYKEACSQFNIKMYDAFLTHYCCKILGDELNKYMDEHTNKKLNVICGHTHSKVKYSPRENILVRVAGASYFKPSIAKLLKIY